MTDNTLKHNPERQDNTTVYTKVPLHNVRLSFNNKPVSWRWASKYKLRISGREQITFREDGDDVRFVLDQNDLLDFDIFSTLKHQSTETGGNTHSWNML
jgi:hypothetical protein